MGVWEFGSLGVCCDMTIRDVTDCCGGKSDILREVCRELWRVGGALRLAGTLECPGSAGPATAERTQEQQFVSHLPLPALRCAGGSHSKAIWESGRGSTQANTQSCQDGAFAGELEMRRECHQTFASQRVERRPCQTHTTDEATAVSTIE